MNGELKERPTLQDLEPSTETLMDSADGINPEAKLQPSQIVRKLVTRIGLRSYELCSDDNYLEHVGKVFEPDMCSLFASLIDRNDLILDIGANIGCTGILFGQLANEVWCFEPSPTTFEILERNISSADLANVKCFNIGLGSENEELTLTHSTNDRSGAFVSNKMTFDADHVTENITIRKGDETVGETKVNLIKIDVEGFELNVLGGLRSTIERCRPVVVMEMNHYCLAVFQRITIPEYLDRLFEIFPIVYAIEERGVANLRHPPHYNHVLRSHLLEGKFANLVCAFEADQLVGFNRHFVGSFD